MKLEKIEGYKINDEILLKDDLNNRGMVTVVDFLTDYIDKYGFKVISVYDYKNDLVVISSNNIDYLKKFGIYATSFIYNYKEGKIVKQIPYKKEDNDDIIHKVEIRDKDNKPFILIDNNIFLLKDEMLIISNSLISYRENGIYYIYDIEMQKAYPISYLANFTDKEPFSICIENDEFTKVIRELDNESINYLINNYNFVMLSNHNTVLKLDTVYGIQVSEEDNNDLYWYNDFLIRDAIYEDAKNCCLGILKNVKEKSM